MSGVAERLTSTTTAGRVESVIVNMEKDSVLLTRLRNGHLAISVDKADALGVFQEISEAIQQLG